MEPMPLQWPLPPNHPAPMSPPKPITIAEADTAWEALHRALRSGSWTPGQIVATLDAGPSTPKQPETMPTPEEILEAGERLAGMVEAVPPKTEAAIRQARMVRDIARQSAYTLRVTAASSRSPG